MHLTEPDDRWDDRPEDEDREREELAICDGCEQVDLVLTRYNGQRFCATCLLTIPDVQRELAREERRHDDDAA